MFGAYRTFLALAVVAHHLLSIPIIGHYAVHGFFILSGYLMTFVMVNVYGYSFKGVRSFAVNRFLRLYPSYWFLLCLTLLVIFFLGEGYSSSYRKFIYIPDSFGSLLQNFSLLYLDAFPGNVSPRLSPPTWALTIELLFYALIALGISRSKRVTTIWFFISVAFMASTHLLELGYAYRYSFVLAGTLPFSIGAMIFHYYRASWFDSTKASSSQIVLTLLMLFVANSGFAAVASKLGLPSYIKPLSFYANYIVNALVVMFLIGGRFPLCSRKIDGIIGNYSYPIYLIHWQAGFVASMIIFGGPVRGFNLDGVIALLLALLLCFVISYLTITLIDTPLDHYRKKVRGKASKNYNSAPNAVSSSPGG